MNQKSNKLTVPDLISVGVFTALYFVLVTVATFACALLPGVGNILLPAVAALISGSVYMLLAAKLQKFGGITIMGLVMGLFFFVSGHFVLSFAANIICGVAADLVAAAGKYRSKKLLLANLMLLFHVGTGAEAAATALCLLLFFLSGKARAGVQLSVLYFGLLAVDLFVVPRAGDGVLLNLLSLVSVGVRMMLPCIITGAYAFSTTTVGELTAALRRMHLPESIIIPCAVVVRFFPTVGEDYRHIRAAMALRGIAAGRGALLRHPVQSLEYILMPLLMNSNNVAQDLSAAALTKGIGLPGRHTCMTELRLTAWDFLYPALCTLPLLWKVVTLL